MRLAAVSRPLRIAHHHHVLGAASLGRNADVVQVDATIRSR